MPQSIPGSGIGQFRNPEMSGASDDGDLSQVLVVGRSPVNCVVVTRIHERSGLKTASETPGTALDALGTIRPGTVILDGGADNHDCDAILARISELRTRMGRKLPRVILLAMRGGAESSAFTGTIDAVVAKPFTPESLQPVVDRLIAEARA